MFLGGGGALGLGVFFGMIWSGLACFCSGLEGDLRLSSWFFVLFQSVTQCFLERLNMFEPSSNKGVVAWLYFSVILEVNSFHQQK